MAYAYGGEHYKDLWISTKFYYSTKLIDMLPRSHPLLSKIAGNNNVKAKVLKGKRFVEPILARVVDKVKAIDYRATIQTQEETLLEMIEVEPKFLYQGVTVYDKEISINNSDELVDLLSVNHRAVREGFARSFARGIYESGAPLVGGKPYNMNGLAYMISENPYLEDLYVYNLLRGGDIGDTQEFWRNRAGQWVKVATPDIDPTADPLLWNDVYKDDCAKKLINAMTMMLLVLNSVSEVSSLEKMEPVVDGIYMNYYFYNLFQYARYQYLKINNVAEQKIDMGFVKLEHMGVPVYLDKNCPMNKIYFIDSSQIDLLYVAGENFKQEVKELPNNFGKQYLTSFMGNYIIHKARNCGVITLNSVDNELPPRANVCDPDHYQDADYQQPDANLYQDSVEATDYSGSGNYKGDSPLPTPTPPPNSAKSQKASVDAVKEMMRKAKTAVAAKEGTEGTEGTKETK
jgi:hypothetical protein